MLCGPTEKRTLLMAWYAACVYVCMYVYYLCMRTYMCMIIRSAVWADGETNAANGIHMLCVCMYVCMYTAIYVSKGADCDLVLASTCSMCIV